MNPLDQRLKGRYGAAEITAGELLFKWQAGLISGSDLQTLYGITEKQLYQFGKAVKESAGKKLAQN